jgi:hypothetical protein
MTDAEIRTLVERSLKMFLDKATVVHESKLRALERGEGLLILTWEDITRETSDVGAKQ